MTHHDAREDLDMPEAPTCPFSRGAGTCAYCSHIPTCPFTRSVYT